MKDTPESTPEKDEDDIEVWLNQLRSSRLEKPTPENEESRVMYQAIVEYHKKQEAEFLKDAQSADHAWQQMRFRLKKEKLLQSNNHWRTWMPMAMAAGILAAVALPTFMATGVDVLYSEPHTMIRGQFLEVGDPLNTAKSVAKKLKEFDSEIKIYWFNDVAIIEVNLEESHLDKAEEIVIDKVPAAAGIHLQSGINQLRLSSKP